MTESVKKESKQAKKTRILDFIENYTNLNGRSPTFEEIQKHFNYKSKFSVNYIVRKLIKTGNLLRVSNHRGLKVIKKN